MFLFKKVVLSLVFINFIFAIIAEYIEVYNDKNIPYYVLCRPKMNFDNSIISAELYTTVADYQRGQNNNGVVFFKRKNSNSFLLNNGIDEISETPIPSNAGLISWSTDNNNIKNPIFPGFYIVEQEGLQYGKENITMGKILSFNASEEELNQFKSQRKGFFEPRNGIVFQKFKPKFKKSIVDNKQAIKNVINIDNSDIEKVYDMKYIKYEIPQNFSKDSELNKFPDRLFYLYKNTLNSKLLKSNAPNYAENNYKVLPKESIKNLLIDEKRYEDTLKLNLSIMGFDATQKYRKDWERKLPYYNIVIQENGGEYQNRIYFLCNDDGKSNDFVPIFQSKDSEKASQIEPLFNYKGDKISFLSRKSNKLYDLFVVDIKDCSDCNSFINNYKNNPLELNYFKIDTDISGPDEWLDLQNWNSYCWHPSKNIIFYIKKEFDEENQNTYPIYYYDFVKQKGGKIKNIPTEANKYPSLSFDGNYLLFSFSGTKTGINNSNYSFENTDKKEFHYNKVHSIGVAKLIYD